VFQVLQRNGHVAGKKGAEIKLSWEQVALTQQNHYIY